MIDTTAVATLAQRYMASLEGTFPDGKLGEIIIVAEVSEDDDEGGAIHTPLLCTTENRVHQTGLLSWAMDLVTDEDAEAGEEMPP